MKKLIVASGLVLVVIIAAFSETSAQTIYSCYNIKSGAMRYVTGPGHCKKTEAQLSWSSNGTPGFDLSRVYTISQHRSYAMCLNDDVSISCTVHCSTDPTTGINGVLESVENYPFGADPETHTVHTYTDKTPGACLAWCLVPYDPWSFITPDMLNDYAADITILCLPRQ